MTVDGVEQKIRIDAIGFDEAGNIRIQEYTTAQNGLKLSRQNLLEDLSKYGGTIVGAGKGDFVGGVEIPKGTRIDVVSQKTGNVTIGPVQVSDIHLPTDSRYDQQLIVDYTETMGTTYTQTDINKLTELTIHNADSDIALLGYFEFESVTSYEQIAHANGYTYFDAGNRGWEAIPKVDPELPYKVNDEFLLKQIQEGKDFVLTSDPFLARELADTKKIGVSYANEIELLDRHGYKIEKFGNFWRAYK